MQEDQVVNFTPMSVGYRVPWFTRLFILYLLVVFVVMVVRVILAAWNLRKLRRLEASSAPDPERFHKVWQASRMRADSLKRIAVLSILLAVADLSLALVDILQGVSTEKASNPAWLAGNVADALLPFAMAMLVCAILYTSSALLERGLMRRKFNFDQLERGLEPEERETR